MLHDENKPTSSSLRARMAGYTLFRTHNSNSMDFSGERADAVKPAMPCTRATNWAHDLGVLQPTNRISLAGTFYCAFSKSCVNIWLSTLCQLLRSGFLASLKIYLVGHTILWIGGTLEGRGGRVPRSFVCFYGLNFACSSFRLLSIVSSIA